MGEWSFYEGRSGGDWGQGGLYGEGEDHHQHVGSLYFGESQGVDQGEADPGYGQAPDHPRFPTCAEEIGLLCFSRNLQSSRIHFRFLVAAF